MTKPKIKAKIKFFKFKEGLAMYVDYIDPDYTWSLEKHCATDGEFMSSVGEFRIYCSPSYTEINPSGKNITLCEGLGCFLALRNRDVSEYLYSLIEALKDWAKNWEGWKDEPAITPIIEEFPGGVVEVTV